MSRRVPPPVRIKGGVTASEGFLAAAGRAGMFTTNRVAARHLRGRRVEFDLSVGSGPGHARALGSDLSADYVRMNAHYRS